ncbi:phospho-sugar mutase [Lachnospiraceae bacterium ZAX-1]
MNARQKYEVWCSDDCFDAATKEELRSIAEDAQEIEDRFYKDLEFGTGGMRGVIGAGTNRMNIYTVRKATQGLANYIIKEGGEEKGIAIAYDSRNMSPEFAQETALCMAANGIKAYIFPFLRPTPMLSFAVRELGCAAGVVITASHNPSVYNGYKVYWADGAQITSPRDAQIIHEVNAITSYDGVKTIGQDEAKRDGLYQEIGAKIDDRYMEELKKLVLRPDAIKSQADKLKIVYTPLHGSGNMPVRRILKELGFAQVYVVEEQEKPDGNFPTVSYPNPEDKSTFVLALALAKKVDAEIVLATDPDADRLGIYAKDPKTGIYESFTGNMSGMLILEYILSQKKELGQLPDNGAVATTIVSGKMAKKITQYYQVALIETLTGFKYIGEQIKFFEEYKKNNENKSNENKSINNKSINKKDNYDYEFLFGYEESYGCLQGTYARDKDAVVAVMVLCEAAAYYKQQGISLCEQMEKLYAAYGYYREDLCTVTLKGQDGAKQILNIMQAIRKNPPAKIGNNKVLSFTDYQLGEEQTNLPKSNVLYFELEDDAWCCVRPSGTEPKIKYYIGVKGESGAQADEKLLQLTKAVEQFQFLPSINL